MFLTKKYLFSFFCLLIFQIGMSQSFTIGFNSLDEKLRDLQLQGKIPLNYSFLSRPYSTNANLTIDSVVKAIDPDYILPNSKIKLANKLNLTLLPVSSVTKFNSDHPYGNNQQGFIDAKGIQTYLSSGVYLKYGMIDAQLMPELVYANNPNFETSSKYGAPTKGTYQRLFMGQSFIRLSYKNLALSLSTENKWWGPGIQNSIIMSNNAPGFTHIALQTKGPIKTPIGNFEFSLLAGKLVEDTSVLLEVKDLTTYYYAQGSYGGYPSIASRDTGTWRYLNSINLVYNPIFAPSLFLFINRLGYTYSSNIGKHGNFLQDYLPVFIGLFRGTSKYYTSDGTNTSTKQIVSLGARYVFQKAHAELYAEYGIGDNTFNLRDFTLSVDHGATFMAGFKKMVPLAHQKWLNLEAEATQLTQSFNNQYRGTGGDWYLYQGSYTNQGRIIGAGYGMVSNMQSLKFSIKNKFSENGILLQRIIHNTTLEPYFSLNKRWIDYSLGYVFQKRIKNLVIQSRTQLVFSDNYAWKINEQKYNLSSQLGLLYFIRTKP